MVQRRQLVDVGYVAALEDDAVLAALAYEVGQVERRVDADRGELGAGVGVGRQLVRCELPVAREDVAVPRVDGIERVVGVAAGLDVLLASEDAALWGERVSVLGEVSCAVAAFWVGKRVRTLKVNTGLGDLGGEAVQLRPRPPLPSAVKLWGHAVNLALVQCSLALREVRDLTAACWRQPTARCTRYHSRRAYAWRLR